MSQRALRQASGFLSAQRPSLSCARATNAGLTAARWLPRLTSASEGAKCSRRAAMPLTFLCQGTARASARARS
jgi:hypothetical protein